MLVVVLHRPTTGQSTSFFFFFLRDRDREGGGGGGEREKERERVNLGQCNNLILRTCDQS